MDTDSIIGKTLLPDIGNTSNWSGDLGKINGTSESFLLVSAKRVTLLTKSLYPLGLVYYTAIIYWLLSEVNLTEAEILFFHG